jgi:hypothetical protein
MATVKPAPKVRSKKIDSNALVRLADPQFDSRRQVVYQFGAGRTRRNFTEKV